MSQDASREEVREALDLLPDEEVLEEVAKDPLAAVAEYRRSKLDEGEA